MVAPAVLRLRFCMSVQMGGDAAPTATAAADGGKEDGLDKGQGQGSEDKGKGYTFRTADEIERFAPTEEDGDGGARPAGASKGAAKGADDSGSAKRCSRTACAGCGFPSCLLLRALVSLSIG
jgi:hypothetical protein